MVSNTISWKSIRDEVLANPEVKAEYDKIKPEFDIARQIIALRKYCGMNQRDFAEMVGIKQPQLARLESGKQIPKIETLKKIAKEAGYSIEIHLIPNEPESTPKRNPLKIPCHSI